MTIIAVYKNHEVEVVETYETGGVKMAAVKAITGKPFVGGDKWAVFTEWTTAPAHELRNVHQDPQPEPTKPNLLDLALEHSGRAQWHTSETVWLWKIGENGTTTGAFLKANHGFVNLCLTGYGPSLTVFQATRRGWLPVNNLRTNYRKWADTYQATHL